MISNMKGILLCCVDLGWNIITNIRRGKYFKFKYCAILAVILIIVEVIYTLSVFVNSLMNYLQFRSLKIVVIIFVEKNKF